MKDLDSFLGLVFLRTLMLFWGCGLIELQKTQSSLFRQARQDSINRQYDIIFGAGGWPVGRLAGQVPKAGDDGDRHDLSGRQRDCVLGGHAC